MSGARRGGGVSGRPWTAPGGLQGLILALELSLEPKGVKGGSEQEAWL